MDHDEIASDTTHGMWEPPGYDESSSTVTEQGTSDYDGGTYGSDDSGTTGPTDSSDSSDSSGGGTSGGQDDGSAGSGTMTVEVEGQTRELPAEKDYTGDGRPDAAAETSDGKVIIFADTEDNATGSAGPDGKADEAYVVDKETGQVVGTAHIDPDSGEWVEGTDTDGPGAVPSSGGTTGETGTGTGETGTGTGETGTGETGETGTETTGGTGTTGSEGPDIVTVEAGGHTIGVVETVDTDGDGEADSGVVYADGRAIVVTNTDADPEAEQVAVVDPETGRVVEVAHVNPETGEWEEGPAPGYGSEDGTGSGSGGSGGTPTDGGVDGTEAGTTTTGAGSGSGSGSMTVEVDGQTRDLPADRDYTGDGRPDAATETSDGKVIVFADTEDNATGAAGPDGKADEAYVVDKRTGQVVGAAHVDPRTGEWVDGMDTDGASAVPSSHGQGS